MPRNNPSRPSSANSTVGKNSKSGKNKMPDWGVKPTRGPKPHEAACISEDVKIGIDLAVERFRKNETQKGQLIGFCTVSQLISVCSQLIGLCTGSQLIGFCTASQLIGLCTVCQLIALHTVSQLTGLCTVNQLIGLCTVSQLIGLCTVSQLIGLCTVRQLIGLSTVSCISEGQWLIPQSVISAEDGIVDTGWSFSGYSGFCSQYVLLNALICASKSLEKSSREDSRVLYLVLNIQEHDFSLISKQGQVRPYQRPLLPNHPLARALILNTRLFSQSLDRVQ